MPENLCANVLDCCHAWRGLTSRNLPDLRAPGSTLWIRGYPTKPPHHPFVRNDQAKLHRHFNIIFRILEHKRGKLFFTVLCRFYSVVRQGACSGTNGFRPIFKRLFIRRRVLVAPLAKACGIRRSGIIAGSSDARRTSWKLSQVRKCRLVTVFSH